jgi:hypothetical protein
MRGPGQHRRRRLLPYLRRVLATPAVYLRSVAGRGATLGAAAGDCGLGCGLGRDARCRYPRARHRLRAGARRSVSLAVFGASVAGWGATFGAAAGDCGLGCGSGLARRRCSNVRVIVTCIMNRVMRSLHKLNPTQA